MEFLVKAQSGGTRRIFKHAQKSQGLAVTTARYGPVATDTSFSSLTALKVEDRHH